MVGLGYHDFPEGLVIEHRPGRTITETDNTLITALSGNTAPIHLDAHYAAHTTRRRILVCSGVTLAFVGGMTVRSTSGLTLANLGLDDVKFENPVFVGDTLYAETEITGRRLSKSRPDNGIVTCRTTGLNQDGVRVVEFTRTFLVPTDPDAVRDATNY
ncbi:MaoC family dehydratase [Kitasatospora aureofaciens]|nr:MaoC family dehydratase [Kitasatospora aureofaciens]ARF83381.1 molybdenum cofactor biosynthesis protein MoeC [Kitasatospora aureofaciens]